MHYIIYNILYSCILLFQYQGANIENYCGPNSTARPSKTARQDPTAISRATQPSRKPRQLALPQLATCIIAHQR